MALFAGCVNVYLQPAPTATKVPFDKGVPLRTPGPTLQPTPGPISQPVATPVSSFTFTSADFENPQYPDPSHPIVVLGLEPYLVTLTVPQTHADIWEWCAISFEGSEGPELKVENDAANKGHSASALMQYVIGEGALAQSLAGLTLPWVDIIISGGACWDWEIHGELQK